jgi:hypothetical protein
VNDEQARLAAAQKKADALRDAFSEIPDGSPMLLVAVTDPETNTRLATGFVTYRVDGVPQLRLVTS